MVLKKLESLLTNFFLKKSYLKEPFKELVEKRKYFVL